MTDLTFTQRQPTQHERLPIAALLALALAGFITILTEALPAGLLSQIGSDMHISGALAGQFVTLYAVGSLVAAIPLINATQGVRRRPLLLIALAGFVVANTVTACSVNYIITMVARFLAGVSAGLVWALLAGYAARMVPDEKRGRAIAIAMVGTPLALSLGVPAGTSLGNMVGWRMCFGIMSVMALGLMVWVRLRVPDFSGLAASDRLPLREVFTLAGVRTVLFVVLTFVLAHNVFYTYIAPLLASVDMAERTDLILLVFGTASLPGIWVVGLFVDRYLRMLTLVSTALFALSAFVLGIMSDIPSAVYMAVAVWGLSFGGAATLFQTAIARAAGKAADVAQSMLVTAWNLAIAGGGITGGVLLDSVGTSAFSPAIIILLILAMIAVWTAKQHGFPAKSA